MLVVAYYERWSGKVAFLGWNGAVSSTPIIADKPTARDTPVRPYLFKEFRRVPQRGWQVNSPSQDVRLTTPGPSTVPRPYLFRDYRRVAWLGWQQAPNDQDQSLRPSIDWRPTRQWARWQPQSWQGWQQESDRASDGPPPPFLIQFRRFPEFRRQPWLGVNAPTDEGGELEAPGAPPQLLHEYLLLGFRPQPQLGWIAAGDLPVVASVPAPGTGLTRSNMFLTRYAYSPYTSSGPGGEPAPPPGEPTRILQIRRWLFHRSAT